MGVMVVATLSVLVTVPVGTPSSVAKIFATVWRSSEPVRSPPIRLMEVPILL
jgi:hypothetical protein